MSASGSCFDGLPDIASEYHSARWDDWKLGGPCSVERVGLHLGVSQFNGCRGTADRLAGAGKAVLWARTEPDRLERCPCLRRRRLSGTTRRGGPS